MNAKWTLPVRDVKLISMNTTYYFSIFFTALTSTLCTAQEKPPVDKKPLDASFLRLYSETRGFLLGRPVNPKITPDGKSVLFLRSEAKNPKRSLYEFDVASGKTKELLTPEAILKGGVEKLTAEEKARRERMRSAPAGSPIITSMNRGATSFCRCRESCLFTIARNRRREN